MIERSLLIWALVLILGFPILNVALGEGVERLQQRGNPLARFLRDARRLFLPTLAILLVMRKIFGVADTDVSLQIVETVVCSAGIVTALSLVNAVLTTRTSKSAWQIQVPSLFFQVARVLVVLCIIGYVLAGVWEVDLSKVAEALGIGSLVIALALQDTLSNLVSGFLLLFEGPFKLGDWIRVGELEGEVMELNWRAVRLKTRDKDVVIIPNGVLGGETIYNYTLLDPVHAESVDLSFPYKYPPNLVKRVLHSTAIATDGILADPPPEIQTKSYEDEAIAYEVRFYIKNFDDLIKIRDEFMTRVYYAAKRNKLTISLPEVENDSIDINLTQQENTRPDIAEYLRSLPYFTSIEPEVIDKLAEGAILEDYGVGEQIVKFGEANRGLYIIRDGSVKLTVKDIRDREQKVCYLASGDIFGETCFLPGELSPVSVKVIDDLQVIIIPRDLANKLIESNPKFALEMNYFIEERSKAVLQAKGIEDKSGNNTARNSRVRSYPLLEN